MVDGPNTPPTGVPTWVSFLARESDCQRRHERSNDAAVQAKRTAYGNRERLITIAGEDGKNGKLSELRKDVDHNTQALKELVPKVNANSFISKAITGGLAALFATIATVAVNFLMQ